MTHQALGLLALHRWLRNKTTIQRDSCHANKLAMVHLAGLRTTERSNNVGCGLNPVQLHRFTFKKKKKS